MSEIEKICHKNSHVKVWKGRLFFPFLHHLGKNYVKHSPSALYNC